MVLPQEFFGAQHLFLLLGGLALVEVKAEVEQLMCHSDIGSTKVYADLLNKTKAKAVRKLPVIMC